MGNSGKGVEFGISHKKLGQFSGKWNNQRTRRNSEAEETVEDENSGFSASSFLYPLYGEVSEWMCSITKDENGLKKTG